LQSPLPSDTTSASGNVCDAEVTTTLIERIDPNVCAKLRQLGDIRRDPPRLIARKHDFKIFGRGVPPK
jgi:hypothetical protein